jgi:Na+/H+-dicarboxylate symporter
MCANHSFKKSHFYTPFTLYSAAIFLGILVGVLDKPWLNIFTATLSDGFIKIFKCLSLPLISLSMIATMKINHNSLKPFIFQ